MTIQGTYGTKTAEPGAHYAWKAVAQVKPLVCMEAKHMPEAGDEHYKSSERDVKEHSAKGARVEREKKRQK